jgi:hypothetical protein
MTNVGRFLDFNMLKSCSMVFRPKVPGFSWNLILKKSIFKIELELRGIASFKKSLEFLLI